MSLKVRFLLLTAVLVATGIGGATLLEVRAIERIVEGDLVDTGRSAAETLATSLRAGLIETAQLIDWLNEFRAADPALNVITVIAGEQQNLEIVASTSREERSEAVDLAARAMEAGRTAIDQTETLVMAAAPMQDERPRAVVVSVSLAALHRVREQGRTVALWFALLTVGVVVLLVDWLAGKLVYRRIALLRSTMRRVAGGELAARTPVERPDELGELASGLNDMLERMEHANVELQKRVAEATTELRTRNAELDASYQRVVLLREALGRAERLAAVGQMAANIAHQVGTPLNLISGYVQMLREERWDVRSRERLDIVERQIGQVTGVLRGILDEARPAARREPTDIGDLIDGACDTVRGRAHRMGVRVEVHLEKPLPVVEADAAQLEAALLNLLSNALDALAEGGVLSVTATPTTTGVRMEVADTGQGFRSDVLPRVFEPWVTTKPRGQGTGLGLGIVREVVRAHGGHVEAGNRPAGGAIVTIELPAVPADVAR